MIKSVRYIKINVRRGAGRVYLLWIVEDKEQQQGKILTIQYMLLLYIALSIGIEGGLWNRVC